MFRACQLNKGIMPYESRHQYLGSGSVLNHILLTEYLAVLKAGLK